MSEDTKKAPEQKFGDQVQEANKNIINSKYIIKSHELIQQGYKVYLLAQGTNTPYKGSRGHLDATNNVRQLTDMFLKYGANSNIGITLKDTGLVVLDIDRHTQNKNGLTSLKKAGITPNFDNEVIEKSPRNGIHVFYRVPDDLDVTKLKRNIGAGLELVTDKITVAPSIKLVDGGGIGYQHFGKDFIHANLMPDWLIELASNVPKSGDTQTGRVPRYSTQERWEMVLNGFIQGQRNNMCVSLSGYLLRINVDPNIAYAIVKNVNENSDVPLAEKEVETIYRSAYQREKQRRLGGR
ncbi:DNA replication protein [Leuconostoc mesenteroides subsp. dextranicum]|uniref:bifunctional DNA primase/polymerase n=1 Tax=Leuconostoc mesenteroides TaxID=1245 RepID=UPI0024A5C607|nr:bifunctional DNA primase/polymerase [Leuconostoc mesenteroides]GLX33025.1 DNA replication protein [Leuconostoc mesenteroides subsp. dextranicum]